MNLISEEVVESCRDRDGRPKEERASRIDDALSRPKLGHRNGEAIVDGYEYEQYPSRDELSQPQWKGFLRDLFAHYLVGSYEDAANELTGVTGSHFSKYVDALRTASDLFGLDANALFNAGDAPDADRLTEILDAKPADAVISADNPTLCGQMYALGMGIAGINEILSDYVDHITEEIVRDCLKRCALIRGEVEANVDRSKSMSMEDYDTRLGGTTITTDETGDIKRKAKESSNITVR